MDPAPIRRWNPGFIALRWRHLFWALPLLGLLVGLVVHFLPMIRGTATGIVQVRPISPSASGLPLFAPSDVARVIVSDDILRQTILALNLPRKWKMEERECMTDLRDTIRCQEIRGTALVEISVSSRSRAESELIWHALVTALQEHFEGLRTVHDRSKLDELEAAVTRQKADFEAKRQALNMAPQLYDLLFRPNSPEPIIPDEVKTLRADFETSQRLLQESQIRLITEKMQQRITQGSLIVHEAPGTPVPVTLWDTLRPLVLHSIIGLAAGTFLAVILAYLLELLFPRKAPTL